MADEADTVIPNGNGGGDVAPLGGSTPPPAASANPAADKTAAELAELREQAQQNEAFRQHVLTVMQGEAGEAAQEQSMRAILADLGYTPNQINAYFQQSRGASQPEGGSVNREDDRSSEQIQGLEEEVREVKREQFKEELSRAVNAGLTGNKDVATLLGRVSNRDKVQGVMASEIRALTVAKAEKMRARFGRFERAWFSELANEAAKETAEKWRTVIGDFSTLGRTPETSDEITSALRNKPPVPAPRFDRRKGPGALQAELEQWSDDYLLRSLADQGNMKV